MSTDIIFKKLQETAEKELTQTLVSAAKEYNRQIGLAGTTTMIQLTDKYGKSIEMYTSDIYEAITRTLFEKRKDSATKDEVNKFLQSVSKLSDQFKLLENLDLYNE